MILVVSLLQAGLRDDKERQDWKKTTVKRLRAHAVLLAKTKRDRPNTRWFVELITAVEPAKAKGEDEGEGKVLTKKPAAKQEEDEEGEDQEEEEEEEEEEEDEDEDEEEEEEDQPEDQTVTRKPAGASSASSEAACGSTDFTGFDYESRRAWRAPPSDPDNKEYVKLDKLKEEGGAVVCAWKDGTVSKIPIYVSEFKKLQVRGRKKHINLFHINLFFLFVWGHFLGGEICMMVKKSIFRAKKFSLCVFPAPKGGGLRLGREGSPANGQWREALRPDCQRWHEDRARPARGKEEKAAVPDPLEAVPQLR